MHRDAGTHGLRRLARRLGTTSAVAAVIVGSGAAAAHAAVDPGLGYDPLTDKGSLYNVAEAVGAHDMYRAGFTGKGVGVALIDTGVAPVPGLTSGNVVQGPDLSFEGQDATVAHIDGYGHGTHLASIIAGRDAVGTPASYLDPAQFDGIAPDATLVDVRAGAGDGTVDVTQVIAGIDWVVAHADDNGSHIRVINLSYGTDSVQSPMVDPLDFAVENAWKHGILVVVSGGNDGDSSKTLADPADDPHVLAVGAMDDAGTADPADDRVPSWSTHGTDARHVDLVAPGVSVLGLRVTGGTADQENPQARVGSRFARASGTSQAAAVVSGEAALLFQANPGLSPDQVKELLTGTASGLPRTSATMGGHGATDLRKAMKELTKVPAIKPAADATWGRGTGSLEAARGSSHVVVGPAVLTGEIDATGRPWDGATWAEQDSDRHAWKEGAWRGETLTGKGWGKDHRTWQTLSPTGDSVAAAGDGDWTASSWHSSSWHSSSWHSSSWHSSSWHSSSWHAGSWQDLGWF